MTTLDEHKAWLDQRELDLYEPEVYPTDLDGCTGIMFGALLGFICWSFIIVACLAAR